MFAKNIQNFVRNIFTTFTIIETMLVLMMLSKWKSNFYLVIFYNGFLTCVQNIKN